MTIYFSVNDLLRLKEELTLDRDERLKEIAGLREKMSEAQAKDQKLETLQEEANAKIQDVSLCACVHTAAYLCVCMCMGVRVGIDMSMFACRRVCMNIGVCLHYRGCVEMLVSAQFTGVCLHGRERVELGVRSV